jgi:hypothetical protein
MTDKSALTPATRNEYVLHSTPIWRHKMDFVFDAALGEDCLPRRFEQLVGRQVADQEFEVCCIPFFLYKVSLGDIVATNADYVVERVARQSRRYTFRVFFGDEAGPKDGPRDAVAAHLELELGALLEWYSDKYLAVDAADYKMGQAVFDYLAPFQGAGQLMVEAANPPLK